LSPRKRSGIGTKATIDHVAARCGFSTATVSRVLTKAGNVRPATVEKVEQAMRELGYTPNSMAMGLSGGRSRTIAILLPDLQHEYYSGLLAGADAAAEESGYDVLVKTNGNSKSLLALAEGGRVDAFVIRNTGFQELDPGFYARMQEGGIPCMFIGRPPDEELYPSVLVDNIGGSRLMARHYIEHGFRRILFVSGKAANLDSNDRVFGFKLGLGEQGYDPEKLFIAEGDYSQASGYAAASAVLARERLDAVFAANDLMALGVMRCCKDRGLRVPEDIAVTGFDDAFFAEQLQPPLSTVRQPFFDIGAVAVRNVIRRLEGLAPLESQVILPTRVQIRRSCGCSHDEPGSAKAEADAIQITYKEALL
jgi:DNA-binding LacI/PurR family transcriptional regulator